MPSHSQAFTAVPASLGQSGGSVCPLQVGLSGRDSGLQRGIRQIGIFKNCPNIELKNYMHMVRRIKQYRRAYSKEQTSVPLLLDSVLSPRGNGF